MKIEYNGWLLLEECCLKIICLLCLFSSRWYSDMLWAQHPFIQRIEQRKCSASCKTKILWAHHWNRSIK